MYHFIVSLSFMNYRNFYRIIETVSIRCYRLQMEYRYFLPYVWMFILIVLKV